MHYLFHYYPYFAAIPVLSKMVITPGHHGGISCLPPNCIPFFSSTDALLAWTRIWIRDFRLKSSESEHCLPLEQNMLVSRAIHLYVGMQHCYVDYISIDCTYLFFSSHDSGPHFPTCIFCFIDPILRFPAFIWNTKIYCIAPNYRIPKLLYYVRLFLTKVFLSILKSKHFSIFLKLGCTRYFCEYHQCW